MSRLQHVLPDETRFRWRLAKHHGQVVSVCTRTMLYGATGLFLSGLVTRGIAGPTGGQITSGTGTISQSGTATNIDQASQQLNINWQTFSSLPNESINFHQPGASALAINRVVGGVPSVLQGALNANGRVIVMNTAGVTFTGTSQVNVGALMATTASNLSIDGDKFHFSGGGYAKVINQGTITVSDGGFAVLAAPYVQNTGVITAKLGQVQLASATSYTLDLRGDGLITFTVDKTDLNDIAAEGQKLGIDNSGTLQARSGTVALTAATASDVVKSVINLDGVVDADALEPGKNGGAILVASNGDLNINGSVHADGGANGNGGTVNTWADDTNTFASGATISARGGDTAGDGGQIDVSGKNVTFRGTATAAAPNGAAGTVTIDPQDIVIADGSNSTSTSMGTQTIYETTIEGMSQGGSNVLLSANNSIVMQGLTTDGVLQGGSGDITLQTTGAGSGSGSISFDNTNNTITTTTGNITIEASGSQANINIGNLATGVTVNEGTLMPTGGVPGNIKVTSTEQVSETSSPGTIVTGNLTALGSSSGSNIATNITVNGPSDVTVDGDILAAVAVADGAADQASADLSLNAGGNLTVTGRTGVFAYAGNTNEGNVSKAYANADLTAGGNVSLNSQMSSGDYNVAGGTQAFTVATGDLLNNVGLDPTLLPAAPQAVAVGALARDTLVDGNSALAKADLGVTAGTGMGGGSLNIAGATLVAADARVLGTGTYSEAQGNGRILGDATAKATANLTANDGPGDITVGDITVDGNALVTLTGDVSFSTTDASLFTNGIIGSADASANLTLNANGGDLTVNGATTVNAHAKVLLDGNITISGFNVYDSSSAVSGAPAVGGAEANATLDASANSGSVNLGSVSVTANATSAIPGDITVSDINVNSSYESSGYFTAFDDGVVGPTSATATGTITADNTVRVTGPTTVIATASGETGNLTLSNIAVEGSYYGSASFFGVYGGTIGDATATADLTASGANGVSMGGGVSVTADATTHAGAIAISGINVALNSGYSGSASFTGFSGTVAGDTTATTDVNLESSSGSVSVTGPMVASATALSEVGDITVSSIQSSSSGSYGASFTGFTDGGVVGFGSANAAATLNAGSGNVSVTGPVAVTASGASTAGDVTINMINVTAVEGGARFTGVADGLLDGATAGAHLNVTGVEGVTLGNAQGGVTVEGTSTVAAGDITISGNSVASGSYYSASASLVGFDSALTSGRSSADATAYISSGYGGGVNLPGGVSVLSDATVGVGNVLISGSAYSTAMRSHESSAYFTGVNGSLLNPDMVSSYSNLNVNANNGALTTGGITVDSNADIAVRGVTIRNAGEGTGLGAYASASGSGASASANFVGISGDVIGAYAEGGVQSTADLNLSASNAVIVNGNAIDNAVAAASVGPVSIDGLSSAIDYIGESGYGGTVSAEFSGIGSFHGDSYGGNVLNTSLDSQARGNISGGGGVTVHGNAAVNGSSTASVGAIAINLGAHSNSSSSDTTAGAAGIRGDVAYLGLTGGLTSLTIIGSESSDVTVTGNATATQNTMIQIADASVTGLASVVADPAHVGGVLGDALYSEGAESNANLYVDGNNVTIGGTAGGNATTTIQIGDLTSTGSAFASSGGSAEYAGFGYFSEALVEANQVGAYVESAINAQGNMTLGSYANSANATLAVGNMSAVSSSDGYGGAIGFVNPYIGSYSNDGGGTDITANVDSSAVAQGNLTVNRGASSVANAIGTVGSFNEQSPGPDNQMAYFEATATSNAGLVLAAGGAYGGPTYEPSNEQGGDLFVTGDVLAVSDAALSAGSNVSIGAFGESAVDEASLAKLILSAHTALPDSGPGGNVTNLYFTAPPHATAMTGNNGSKFTQATQADLDTYKAAHASPYTFVDDPPPASTTVHWHGVACIANVTVGCGGGPAPTPFINPLLPIAGQLNNGLDLRLTPRLNNTSPAVIVVVPPPPVLGILPGGQQGTACVIGATGVAASLGAQTGCGDIGNFPPVEDLLQ